MEIIKGMPKYLDQCMEIGRQLKKYFNEKDIRKIDFYLHENTLYVVLENEKVLGFATVVQKSKEIAEMTCLAVEPSMQSKGLGSDLLDKILKDLKSTGTLLLEVKTLSEKSPYPPYEKTRCFYRKKGFFLLETIDPYPPWGQDSPCAIYIKIL